MNIFIKHLFFLSLIKGILLAQIISVDMNPSDSGIQNNFNATTADETFIVDFVASDFSGVSGYQYKIVFDSSKFEFIDGQPDYGLSGTKNILKNNGGTITGIFQKQINPPCDSILDVAYTINGTVDLSVSGEGLIGIVQFKSKLNSGESGNIIIKEGYWISFDGIKTPVENYSNGVYSFNPVKIDLCHQNNTDKFNIYYRNNFLNFSIPPSDEIPHVKILLFDLKGELLSVLLNDYVSNGSYKIALHCLNSEFSQGFYLCNLRSGDFNKAIKVLLGR